MIYLDNASTTFHKPRCVKKIVRKSLNRYTANAGRSGHDFAIKTYAKLHEARCCIAKTFACSPERVIFTSGCTESLNLAIRGSCKIGGHVLVCAYSHNSVLRVVEHLKSVGKISYSVVFPNKKGYIEVDELEKCKMSNTYMLIVNHISNVTGIKQDIEKLGKWAKSQGIYFLVDAAQSAGHSYIDIKKCNITYLALAGHKGLLSLQGVGALCVNDDAILKPIKYGGTGTESENLTQPTSFPEGFESGTLGAINAISMGVGTSYAYKYFISINNKILKLAQKLINFLMSDNTFILYSPKIAQSGVVSFNIRGMQPNFVSQELNEKFKIALRSGYACAPYVHQYLDSARLGGVVRVSVGANNSLRQINKLIKALKKIKEQNFNKSNT